MLPAPPLQFGIELRRGHLNEVAAAVDMKQIVVRVNRVRPTDRLTLIAASNGTSWQKRGGAHQENYQNESSTYGLIRYRADRS